MLRLLSTETIRDGGSLCAEFERPDGSHLRIFLQVAARSAIGGSRQYRHLHIGAPPGQFLTPFTRVAKGSTPETAALVELDSWLDGAARTGEDENRVAFVRDLRLRISERLD